MFLHFPSLRCLTLLILCYVNLNEGSELPEAADAEGHYSEGGSDVDKEAEDGKMIEIDDVNEDERRESGIPWRISSFQPLFKRLRVSRRAPTLIV